MSSPTANEATIREAVRATIALLPLDKITGQPTNSSVNHLKQQVAKIASAVKTTKWGGRHGHLALVLTDTEYQTVTGSADITTERGTAPPIVPEALANNATLTSRTRVMADHNLACQEFWLQEAVDSIIVDRIVREVIDAAYVEELEDDYVGYNTQSIKSILSHLRSEWCIITTLERKQAADDFRVVWDLTSHITKYPPPTPPKSNTSSRACTQATCSTTKKCKRGRSCRCKPGRTPRPTSSRSTRARRSSTLNERHARAATTAPTAPSPCPPHLFSPHPSQACWHHRSKTSPTTPPASKVHSKPPQTMRLRSQQYKVSCSANWINSTPSSLPKTPSSSRCSQPTVTTPEHPLPRPPPDSAPRTRSHPSDHVSATRARRTSASTRTTTVLPWRKTPPNVLPGM